jgi:hypothetical protein
MICALSQFLKNDFINNLAVRESIHHYPGVDIIDLIDNPEPLKNLLYSGSFLKK